jgi:hypothetical protein
MARGKPGAIAQLAFLRTQNLYTAVVAKTCSAERHQREHPAGDLEYRHIIAERDG